MASEWEELKAAYDANLKAMMEYFVELEKAAAGDPLARARQTELTERLVETHREFVAAGAKMSRSGTKR